MSKIKKTFLLTKSSLERNWRILMIKAVVFDIGQTLIEYNKHDKRMKKL